MVENIKQQDIINYSFRLAVERENQLMEKCKQYKSGNKDETVTELIGSLISHSSEHIDKIPKLADKLKLNQTSKIKITLAELDKLQILLDDKIQLYKLYNDFIIRNENPEVRKLFILFRDSNTEDIFHLQQSIQRLAFTQKPVSKSIK